MRRLSGPVGRTVTRPVTPGFRIGPENVPPGTPAAL